MSAPVHHKAYHSMSASMLCASHAVSLHAPGLCRLPPVLQAASAEHPIVHVQTRQRLFALLHATATGSQPSVSVMLIGPRGVGKTLVRASRFELAALKKEACNAVAYAHALLLGRQCTCKDP